MSSTDYLKLNEHKIFKELRESLPKDIAKTLNLLCVHDDVLFTWDFQSSHVLCLNVKMMRGRRGDDVIHQKLLPIYAPLFSPESIIANEKSTLLAVFGPAGILVLELPARCPPYGAFDNNKEVVYCRSHSLDERLLSCNDAIEVRQVRFHPGSIHYNHVLALTSDNMIRLYQIKNNNALNVAVIPIGDRPIAMFPGSKTPFLECFGEVAVDFDFGHPETLEGQEVKTLVPEYTRKSIEEKYMINVETQTVEKIIPKEFTDKENEKRNWQQCTDLIWPIYLLRGDLSVYVLKMDIYKRKKPVLSGPIPLKGFDSEQNEGCSITCLNAFPQIVCIALSNGTIYQSLIMNNDDDFQSDHKNSTPDRQIVAFEIVELELGLLTAEDDSQIKYKCPVFLRKDNSKLGRYYATHSAGVHSIDVSCVDELQNYINDAEDISPTLDIFSMPSKVEYLICTKTTVSEKANPVIGFSIYYEPSSVIALLSDGSLISLSVLYTLNLPTIENLSIIEDDETHSPLKKMLKEPFDVYIQKILKKTATQPVLKLSTSGDHTQEECYDVLQRTAQVFRDDYFKHHTTAREELEKRVKTLTIMKKNQQKEIERMTNERDNLQEKASNLAEKYEDIKDKQDDLLKQAENLLMLVNRKKSEPSDAEKTFMADLQSASEKVILYIKHIDKIKDKMKYQQIQVENWKSQETKKVSTVNETHLSTIRSSLKDSTEKITVMMKEIQKFKEMLNLK